MRDDLLYVFFGFGGEYVLSPIYEEMVGGGFECVQFDIGADSDFKSMLARIKGRKIVLITCAHLFMDRMNMERLYPGYPEVISVLEVMDYLQPVKSVYYPHDLLDGFTHFDKYWFSLFDVYLSPLPINHHGMRFCRVEDVGWVKKKKPVDVKERLGSGIRIGHGMGYFEYYKRKGLEYMYDIFRPVWDFGVRVKLPGSLPDRQFCEEFFSSKNVPLYPEDSNIFDMIEDSDVVITNATTGVTVEAALSGKTVINLYDPAGFPKSSQLAKVAGLPNTYVKTISEAISMLDDIAEGRMSITSGKDVMRAFDMKKAVSIISGGAIHA